MYVTRQEDVAPQDAGDAPLFYGGRVTRPPLVGRPEPEDSNVGLVSFSAGAKICLYWKS